MVSYLHAQLFRLRTRFIETPWPPVVPAGVQAVGRASHQSHTRSSLLMFRKAFSGTFTDGTRCARWNLEALARCSRRLCAAIGERASTNWASPLNVQTWLFPEGPRQLLNIGRPTVLKLQPAWTILWMFATIPDRSDVYKRTKQIWKFWYVKLALNWLQRMYIQIHAIQMGRSVKMCSLLNLHWVMLSGCLLLSWVLTVTGLTAQMVMHLNNEDRYAKNMNVCVCQPQVLKLLRCSMNKWSKGNNETAHNCL